MVAINSKAQPSRPLPAPQRKVIELHPDQTPDARRRALRATYRGPDYGDGKTVRLVRNQK